VIPFPVFQNSAQLEPLQFVICLIDQLPSLVGPVYIQTVKVFNLASFKMLLSYLNLTPLHSAHWPNNLLHQVQSAQLLKVLIK